MLFERNKSAGKFSELPVEIGLCIVPARRRERTDPTPQMPFDEAPSEVDDLALRRWVAFAFRLDLPEEQDIEEFELDGDVIRQFEKIIGDVEPAFPIERDHGDRRILHQCRFGAQPHRAVRLRRCIDRPQEQACVVDEQRLLVLRGERLAESVRILCEILLAPM